jgi:hypothetical integral membrane protein (TIGR02206 family)
VSYGVVLAAVLASIAALFFTAKRSVRARRSLLSLTGFAALACFPWLTAVELSHGIWTLGEGLPLHLCDVTAFAVGFVSLRASRHESLPASLERPAELCFYLCTGGGLAGLLIPQQPPTSPTYVPFLVWHASLVLAPLLLVAHGMAPTFAGVGRSLAALVALALFVGLVNLTIDANYMFLMRAPAGTEALLTAAPFHVLPLLGLGAVTMFAMWLPFRASSLRRPPSR